jgi:hypothetical protein
MATTIDPALWNALHDAEIVRLEGSVPCDVEMHLDIGYLRRRFGGEGTRFVVHLSRCTRFAFQPWDEAEVTDFAAIAAMRPWIYGASEQGPATIDCTQGTLSMSCDGVSVSLDTGASVTLRELMVAAEAYWAEWSARAATKD